MKIAITGHRPNKLGNDYDLVSPLIQNIKKEIIENIKPVMYADPSLMLITGMALGIDTLFAIIAIELQIPFIAAVPFIGQESRWLEKSKMLYNRLLSCARKIVVVSQGNYSADKMQKRNEWMVDHCDVLIAVWNGTPGGTCNCINYAYKVKKHVIIIDPNKLTDENI